jgi:integrase
MRIRLKGLNAITKELADGSERTYWYAWKSGPALRGEPSSPDFIASYNEAVASKVAQPSGTLLGLLNEYQASTDFTDLAKSTRRGYVAHIKRIEQDFADFPLKAMTDRRTRGVFVAWRDEIAKAGRRQADYAWSVLALVLSWGFDRGKIGGNPCERGRRLYGGGERVDKIWTEADEAAFLERGPSHLHLPLLLALWTGLRQKDLLSLPWSAYDGTHLRLLVSKSRRRGQGGRRVVIKAGATLKAALDATPKRSTIILTNSDGQPWTSDGFRASWRKACEKAGVVDLTFHDIRGTAVSRLALVEATDAEIATLTGLSLNSVRAILDKYYLHRDPALADAAITKLERGTKTPN